MKYGAGLPFYRQSGIQQMCGGPLSESQIWERCESVADAGFGVFLWLRRLAADGEVIQADDTWVRILSCMKDDQEKQRDARRATQTSGSGVKVGNRKIARSASGRRQAGENLEELLKLRSAELPRPIELGDALAANWSGREEPIGAKCLAHARRQVFELVEIYPAAGQVVLEAVGEGDQFDAATAGLSAAERWVYHEAQSGPVMERLKKLRSNFGNGWWNRRAVWARRCHLGGTSGTK